jgi:hypothetical protein
LGDHDNLLRVVVEERQVVGYLLPRLHEAIIQDDRLVWAPAKYMTDTWTCYVISGVLADEPVTEVR